MWIKDFIRNNRTLDFWQRCIRFSRDKYFVENVRAIYRDPNMLYFECFGNQSDNLNFYNIYMDYPSKGFFALFIQTLDALSYAERFNLIPVVTWSDNCLYKEERAVNGSLNPFNYYFEPVNEYNVDVLKTAKRVLKYNDSHRALDVNHQFSVVSKMIVDNNCYSEYIAEKSLIYSKYIRYKKDVLDYLENNIAMIGVDEYTLGVHIRATDFNKGYINHAVAITLDEYIKAIQEAIENNAFKKVFIATDDENVIKEIQRIFSGNLIYCKDSYRSTDGQAVHFSTNNRENHRYKLGLEVIKDMYLLSKCGGFIGCYSNVSIAAQIANQTYENNFKYVRILDKGFNVTGITTFQDHFKKRGINEKK